MGSSIENSAAGLPKGKYTLIGIDVDTTGRRLIDEIVQLAAYTPKTQYAQYIMPYMNLNPAARQRHQVRVITIGFYRMLKCMQTYKVVKSKSEVAALREFLDWLETLKNADKDSQGVIFVYHEERKFVPYMILEAMKKYNMLDRFLETVKSFANGYALAKTKCATTVKYFTLRQLSKVLLNTDDTTNNNNTANNNNNNATSSTKPQKSNQHNQNQNNNLEQFEGSAAVRAKLAFEIAHHLAKSEQQDLPKDNDFDNMIDVIYQYATPINQEIDELEIESKNIERQNSFRPVFLQYFKTTLYHRVKAVKFRIILSEHGHDLETLKAIWDEKKRDGISEVIESIEALKTEEKSELVELFDSHFDPLKQQIRPVGRRASSAKRRPRHNRNKENVGPRDNQASGDNRSAPDSTVKSPMKKGNRARNSNSVSNNTNNNNKTVLSSN